MKKIFSLLIVFIGFHGFAQEYCQSSLTTTLSAGPDSLSTDGNQTFRSLSVNPLNPNSVYVGTEGNGIFYSKNGGNDWVWERDGLKNLQGNYAETWCITINPNDTTQLLMGTTDSPGPCTGSYPSSRAGVYYSGNAGNNWYQRNCGFTSSKASFVWHDPKVAGRSYAIIEGGVPSFGSPPQPFYDGGIYYSDDTAKSWQLCNIPAIVKQYECIKVIQVGDTLLSYSLDKTGTQDPGFIASYDGGQNWQFLSKPLAGRKIFEFAVSPVSKTILAVVRDSFIVYKSTDFGLNWSKEFFQGNGFIQYDKHNDNKLYILSGMNNTDLYVSYAGFVDGNIMSNSAYHPVLTVPNNKKIESLVVAPSDSNIVYVAASGYIVYKSIDAGKSFVHKGYLRNWMIEPSTPTSIIDNLPEVNGVFPNPFDDYLILNNYRNETRTIRILNCMGQCVYSVSTNLDRVEIPYLGNNGLYYIIVNNNNEVFQSYKLMYSRTNP